MSVRVEMAFVCLLVLLCMATCNQCSDCRANVVQFKREMSK